MRRFPILHKMTYFA